MSIWTDEGYKSRRHYLECLSEETGCPLDKVMAAAAVLGPSEDFDGLVTMCEDEAQ